MSYELEGSIKMIGDTLSFGSKGFTKREIVVTTVADKFPQDIKFEFVKDKTALLDAYKPGQQVKVTFDIRGGEYNGKYFVNLTGWRIEASDGSSRGESRPSGENRGQAPARKNAAPADDLNQQSGDEYPF